MHFSVEKGTGSHLGTGFFMHKGIRLPVMRAAFVSDGMSYNPYYLEVAYV
jgi:hypothetical protein